MPATKAPDAGELRENVEVLNCTPPGCEASCEAPCEICHLAMSSPQWAWRTVRQAYAKAEITNRLAIFANSGVAGRETTFTIRRQGITLRNAIRWKGGHYFITSVEPLGSAHLTVRAALVQFRPVCKGVEAGTKREITFPGVVAERYMGHTQEEPMAQNTIRLTLVTPKAIVLKLGSIVDVGDPAPYWVKVPHELDPDKNEYEIERIVEP